MSPDRYLRRSEVPAFLKERLGVAPAVATLNKWASTGEGPKFIYFGRIPVYSEAAVLAWGRAHLTTEPVHLGAKLPLVGNAA